MALVVLAVILALLFARLGLWQLDRSGERQALNELSRTRLAMPAVVLPAELNEIVAAATPESSDSLLWRRFVAHGVYDFANEMVLRGRSFGGTPGVDVLTPLVLVGEEPVALLVKRGWLPAADALRPDLAGGRPPGTLEATNLSGALPAGPLTRVEGIVLPGTEGVGSAPVAAQYEISGRERTALRSLDLVVAAAELPYRLLPFYLLGTEPGADGVDLRPPAVPDLEPGPHLSYAIQWFSFAAISILGTAVFVLRSGKARARGPEKART